MNIYVGNLNFRLSEDELTDIFREYGDVESAKIIMDRETGRSKGFGFVTMPNSEEANAAIENLDGADVSGRALRVNEAKERSSSDRGGYNRSRNRY